jgi:hypothetical protein
LPSGPPLGVVLLVTEDGCEVLTSYPYDLQPRTPRSGGPADGKWPMTTLSSWDVADGPGVTALGPGADVSDQEALHLHLHGSRLHRRPHALL